MVEYPRHEVERRAWATPEEILARRPEPAHREFLRRAIANARKAGIEERTGWPFGAVIVDREGNVVAEGSNHVMANFDPTAHGEVQAIRAACAKLRVISLEGCVLYSSSEPCPMCLAAAYWAGVDGVIFGATAADASEINGFDDAFLYREFAAPASRRGLPTAGLPRDEAVAVLREFDAENPEAP